MLSMELYKHNIAQFFPTAAQMTLPTLVLFCSFYRAICSQTSSDKVILTKVIPKKYLLRDVISINVVKGHLISKCHFGVIV